MKAGIVLVVLWLAASQTVSYSNCCKGSLCSDKQDCPPCGSESESEDGRACCDQDAASAEDSTGSETPCVHLEPSSDVVSEGGVLNIEGPSTAILEEQSNTGSDANAWVLLAFAPGMDPPTRRPKSHSPLYILDRVLRI